MGMTSRSYDEAALCPRVMPPAWWFSLPSQTRTRIKAETDLPVSSQVVFVGEVQDALIAKGLSRLMGTYMRAMQACLDQEKVDLEAAMQESQVRNAMADAATLVSDLKVSEQPWLAPDPECFGFHEPRA